MIQLLLKRYFALPRNTKIAILLTIFLSIVSLIIWGIYAIVMLFRPNPNGWENVSKLGISMPLRYEVHGIDVSHHNGEINWKKVEKMRFEDNRKIEFAFLKATERYYTPTVSLIVTGSMHANLVCDVVPITFTLLGANQLGKQKTLSIQ
jgi:hypothetical protein